MNLYHDHGITYNFWGLWILQLSICLNKKGAWKTHEKLDWSARQHLNNEFYGHLLSFLLDDFLLTRHFWQWERNSYYSSDNREQREQTGGLTVWQEDVGWTGFSRQRRSAPPGHHRDPPPDQNPVPSPFPEYWHPWHGMICSNAYKTTNPDRWRMWAEFWTRLWIKEKMRVANW